MTQKSTAIACQSAMITQGIVNNLLPVMLVIFKDDFGISYGLLANLLLLNFTVQLVTDLLAIKIINKTGYRISGIIAQCAAALGLIFMGVVTRVIPVYPALIISVIFMAFGGGMLEVILSPIVENLTYGSSSARMNMLHSFFCWGQLITVLVSTLALKIFSNAIWWIIPLFWAIAPLINIVLFSVVPMPQIPMDTSHKSAFSMFKSKTFIVMCVLMVCAGAAEISMSQWASVFAQKGIGVDKVTGDILGPCLFAVLMGTGRTLYGLFASKLKLRKALFASAFLCFLCYILTGILNNPYLALFTCAFTGFTVSIMWPGIYSFSAKKMATTTTAMYGILALFGDLGCSVGSWLCGTVSEISLKFESVIMLSNTLMITPEQMGLKLGIMSTAVFPLLMLILLLFTKMQTKPKDLYHKKTIQ